MSYPNKLHIEDTVDLFCSGLSGIAAALGIQGCHTPGGYVSIVQTLQRFSSEQAATAYIRSRLIEEPHPS